MPSPDRCPRCDRAESECDRRAAHLAFNAIAKRYPNVRPGQTVAGEYDDALTRMCRADEDCKPVDWRAEALALRARLAADRPRVPLARRSDGWTLDVTPPDGSRVGVQQIPVDVRADFIASLDGGDRLASPPADTRTWSDGVRDAIKCVQGRRRIAEILAYVPAYFAALDEALVFLEAGLERGTMRSTSRVDGTDAPAASPPSLAPLRARAEALLAVADRATPGRWRAEPAYNNGGIPTADFYIPGHNGGATVEMVADDAYAIVALHNEAPALIRDLLAALAGED